MKWHNAKRKVSDLMPHKFNPRQMTEKEVKDLTASLKKFNLAEIPVINTDNQVLAGHQRLKILALLGRGNEKIDVRMPDKKLSKKDAEEYLIRSNRNHGDWDEDLLANHFEVDNLVDWGFGKDELGFFDDEGGTVEDPAPEPPANPTSKEGDLYLMGDHRLLCGSCTSPDAVAKLMDGAKAQMIFTDPPYGVSYKGTNNPNGREWKILEGDDLRGTDLQDLLTESFALMAEHSIDEPAAYICHASSNYVQFMTALQETGWTIRQQLIWHKGMVLGHSHYHWTIRQQLIWHKGMVLGHSHYHWTHEPIIYASKKKMPEWFGDRTAKTMILNATKTELVKMKKEDLIAALVQIQHQSTIMEIKRDPAGEYVHPTQKPVELPATAIINSCMPGGIVYDPFTGSGSTLSACEQLDRTCYCMELDPKYCDVTVQRWEALTKKKAKRERA